MSGALSTGRFFDGSGSAPGGGGISFVGSATISDNAAGTFLFSSLQDEGGAAPTILEGDLIVVVGGIGSTTDRPASEMKPSTATYDEAFANLYFNDSGDANLLVSYKFMGSTPDTSFDYTSAVGNSFGISRGFLVFALRGVNPTTPIDVTPTTEAVGNSGRPNPPAIEPATGGAWIMACGSYGHLGDRILLTNPGDLSTATNHFRSVLGPNADVDGGVAAGFKEDWVSGSFDPAQFGGGTTNSSAARCAATIAFRPV